MGMKIMTEVIYSFYSWLSPAGTSGAFAYILLFNIGRNKQVAATLVGIFF